MDRKTYDLHHYICKIIYREMKDILFDLESGVDRGEWVPEDDMGSYIPYERLLLNFTDDKKRLFDDNRYLVERYMPHCEFLAKKAVEDENERWTFDKMYF